MAGQIELLTTRVLTHVVGHDSGGLAGRAALNKAAVGLGNVDNTADASKPVSTAQAAADALRLLLTGGTLTGALTLSADPVSALQPATKQYVDAKVLQAKLIAGTIDLSTASGSLPITGVGFRPTALIAIHAVNGTMAFGAGFADAARVAANITYYDNNTATFGSHLLQAFSGTGGTNYKYADVTSYDADGCTLGLTKVGTPTGTDNYYLLFLR